MGHSPLTPKQERFVQEYLVDLNGKQAAIRAGYSERRAEVTASELLASRKVSEAVAHAMEQRKDRTEVTQDRVLQEIARIAFFDIRKLYREEGGLKDPHELDENSAAVLTQVEVVEEFQGKGEDREKVGYTKKVKVADKIGALTLAARHLGMLRDKQELSGPGGGPIQTQSTRDLTDKELADKLARYGLEPRAA